jgi:hypothetical protein
LAKEPNTLPVLFLELCAIVASACHLHRCCVCCWSVVVCLFVWWLCRSPFGPLVAAAWDWILQANALPCSAVVVVFVAVLVGVCNIMPPFHATNSSSSSSSSNELVAVGSFASPAHNADQQPSSPNNDDEDDDVLLRSSSASYQCPATNQQAKSDDGAAVSSLSSLHIKPMTPLPKALFAIGLVFFCEPLNMMVRVCCMTNQPTNQSIDRSIENTLGSLSCLLYL